MSELEIESKVTDDFEALSRSLDDLQLILDVLCEQLLNVIGNLVHNLSEEEQSDEEPG